MFCVVKTFKNRWSKKKLLSFGSFFSYLSSLLESYYNKQNHLCFISQETKVPNMLLLLFHSFFLKSLWKDKKQWPIGMQSTLNNMVRYPGVCEGVKIWNAFQSYCFPQHELRNIWVPFWASSTRQSSLASQGLGSLVGGCKQKLQRNPAKLTQRDRVASITVLFP